MLRVIFKPAGDLFGKTFFKKEAADVLMEDLEKIAKNIIEGAPMQNKAGSRLWPNRTLDAKIGIRLDWGSMGEAHDQKGVFWQAIDLQINANAENSTLAAKVAKDGAHQKRVTILIQVNSSGQVLASRKELMNSLVREFIDVARAHGI